MRHSVHHAVLPNSKFQSRDGCRVCR